MDPRGDPSRQKRWTTADPLYAGRATAAERIPLFRLAWDTALSAFGTRQVLYERFFFDDPVRMASVVFQTKDRTAVMERVRQFLAHSQPER